MRWEEFSRIDLEALVPPRIMERGLNYYREGQLIKACRIGPVLCGVLLGSGANYHARLWWTDLGLKWDCNCPYPEFCKHLVALALAWIERGSGFIDLTLQLDQICGNPQAMPEFVRGLAFRNPLDFGELWDEFVRGRCDAGTEIAVASAAPSERGLLNLVRNLFPSHPLTPETIRELWDRVERISRLLLDRMVQDDIGAARALAELTRRMTELFPVYPDPVFRSFLTELGDMVYLKLAKAGPEIRAVFLEVWWALYFNPELWDIRPELGKWLRQFRGSDPQLFSAAIRETLTGQSQFLILIGLFELLDEPTPAGNPGSPDTSSFRQELNDIRCKLRENDEGCLWLIDRLREVDPDQALRIANTGLRRNSGLKDSYRERLIILHQLRGDLRQAAALSFVQFREKPVLEEYLRLRDLLAKSPSDWAIYRGRIKELMENQALGRLAIQIALADRDSTALVEQWPDILADPQLLLNTAGLFQEEDFPLELAEFFPQLIRALLETGGPEFYKSARATLIRFKKFCYRHDHRSDWDDLRRSLLEEYRDDLGFRYKFGSLLDEL
ncbi:MAG TPA: SWIM zinc finger family protein [Bacillota bacterium]